MQNSLSGGTSVELVLFAYQRVRWNIQNLPDPANGNFTCEVVSARFENSQFQKGRWEFVVKKLQISNVLIKQGGDISLVVRTPKQIQNVGGYLDSENAQSKESRFATGPQD